jgi:Flp pilus assembly CpaE family ATPase
LSGILSLLALVHSPDCAAEVEAVAATMPDVRLETVRLETVRLETMTATERPGLADAPSPPTRVLVVDCRAGEPGDRALLAGLVRPGGPPVIALVPQATIGDVRELMRLGVIDVVPRPLAADDFRHALDQASLRVAALPRNQGSVFAFLGSCGGAGVSTLALQTALELRQGDKRRPPRVCLLDFDLQFGSVGLALDMGPSSGLGPMLEASTRLDGAFIASAMSHHATGVDVLTAPGEIVPFEAMSVDLALKIMAYARETYDHVVVDLPHAWTAWTPAVLAASSLLAIVLRPDVVGVRRTLSHLRLMDEERLGALPTLLVANRVDRRWGGGWRARLKEAAELLGREVSASIGRDDETADGARERGLPLSGVRRASVIEKDVRTFVRLARSRLSGATAPAIPPRPDAADKGRSPHLANAVR